ncbi:triacylglycerol lipase 2-like protein, partial [Trifolium pratense]
MVLLGLMQFSVLSLCFLVLTTFPYQVSSRGIFGRKPNGAYPSLDDGICATSVIVHGYKCQELQVTTQDGYILSLQRIPEGRGKGSNGGTRKQPVLLQHGVLV